MSIADDAAAYLAGIEDLARRLLADWASAGDRWATIDDARRIAAECYTLTP